MTASEQLTTRITNLIEEVLMVDVASPDVDLIGTGLIDSLALVTLITEVEAEFGISLPLEEFDVDNFRSAEQIAAYVSARLPEGQPG